MAKITYENNYFPKYGDLTVEQREELFQYLQWNENLEAMMEDLMYSRFACRYLCSPNYNNFYNIIHNKFTEIEQPLIRALELYDFTKQDTLVKPYSEDYNNTTDNTVNRTQTVTDNGSNDSTTNSTGTNNITDHTANTKVIDTSIVETVDSGNDTFKTNDVTTDSSIRTGSETDNSTKNDSNVKTGSVNHTKTGTEDRAYSGSETSTDTGSNKQSGVRTTSVSPSATFTTKTITSNINTPMSTTSTLGMTGISSTGYRNDLITDTTPTSMDITKLSDAQQEVSFNSLDRESDGSYKKNVTTETIGATGSPLTTDTTNTNVKTFNGRKDTTTYNTTDKESYESVTDTGRESSENTHTYNSVKDDKNGTSKLDQTTTKNNKTTVTHKDSESSGDYVETKVNLSEHTTNSNDTTSNSSHTNTNDLTGKETGNMTAKTNRTGFLGNDRINKMQDVYKLYVDMQPILQRFINYLEPCFSCVYEGLDDREWYEYGELLGKVK